MGNKIFEGVVFVQIWEEMAELISLKLLVEEKQKSTNGDLEKNGTKMREEEFIPPNKNGTEANFTN